MLKLNPLMFSRKANRNQRHYSNIHLFAGGLKKGFGIFFSITFIQTGWIGLLASLCLSIYYLDEYVRLQRYFNLSVLDNLVTALVPLVAGLISFFSCTVLLVQPITWVLPISIALGVFNIYYQSRAEIVTMIKAGIEYLNQLIGIDRTHRYLTPVKLKSSTHYYVLNTIKATNRSGDLSLDSITAHTNQTIEYFNRKLDKYYSIPWGALLYQSEIEDSMKAIEDIQVLGDFSKARQWIKQKIQRKQKKISMLKEAKKDIASESKVGLCGLFQLSDGEAYTQASAYLVIEKALEVQEGKMTTLDAIKLYP